VGPGAGLDAWEERPRLQLICLVMLSGGAACVTTTEGIGLSVDNELESLWKEAAVA